MLNYRIRETVYEKKYEIPVPCGELTIASVQNAGEKECRFHITAQVEGVSKICVRYGATPAIDSHLVLDERGCGVTEALPARGTEYYFLVECDGQPITDVMCLRAIHRYPYGRTFLDNKSRYTQHFGQEPVIDYDLEYFTTSEPLDHEMRALETTDPACYIEHILRTILRPGMSVMEQCKSIWAFLGKALQHNAMLLNLKESCKAQERFMEDYRADNDAVVVAIMEQGFTRCGFINGFISATFLKRIGVENRAIFACGGHTMGQAYIDGAWRFWDADGFKEEVPVDDKGDIPVYDWVVRPENIYLLDTFPSWEDTPAEEGWLTAHDGHRVTGYVDGCRSHAVTGFTSTWFGAPKSYPPSVPEPLPVTWRSEEKVRLEWMGSYDRSNNFRDYYVRITDSQGKEVSAHATTETGITLSLPVEAGYHFTVECRSWHGRDTKYFDKIYYTKSFPMEIPAENLEKGHEYDLLRLTDGRTNYVVPDTPSDFQCLEGADNILGQTRFAKTDFFKISAGVNGRPVYRMVDETNYLFSGCRIRSLFACPLRQMHTQKDGWHFTAVMRITPYDFAGLFRFPVLWIGRRNSNIGVGIGMDCKKGLLYAASNIMGDWRYNAGFEPKGYFRLDICCRTDQKILDYYVDGRLIHTDDYSMFWESVLDVDTIFASGNPDAETGYLVFDLLV